MTKKTPIRIIKRNERNQQENNVESTKSTRETAREMVQTVTTWVSEFQQRQRTGTKQAIKSLFQEPSQPNEA